MKCGMRIDDEPKVAWRISLGRMMAGVAIAAMFLTEESRIILVGLTYFLYPITMIWLSASRRLVPVARDRPASWRLSWIAFAGLLTGWPFLLRVPNIPDDEPWLRPLIVFAKALIFAPVAIASLVAWLLVPLPRMERIRP